jgi:hypothetical protein
MKTNKKKVFPLTKIRRFFEPGPIVLVSSAHEGERNVMTLGWHMMMGFGSFSLIRRSKECVINLPTFDLVDAVIGVGNSHGPGVDKFEAFGLTPAKATKVGAPLIAECYANFECRLADASLDRPARPVCVRDGQGARGDVAPLPDDGPLPWGRGVHGIGP